MSIEIIRRQIIEGLITAKCEPLPAEAIADVAIHSSEEAIRTVKRLCASLPGDDKLSANCIALQLLEELARINAADVMATKTADGIPAFALNSLGLAVKAQCEELA